MTPKKSRVDKKTVEKIFKEGRFLNSANLALKFIINKTAKGSQFSFIVPKGLVRLAVKRNFLRRKGYAALRKEIKDAPLGTVGVFIFKKTEVDEPTLKNEIKTIFNKIN